MSSLPVVRHSLANGLQVAVIEQPHLQRAHVALWVRVGSRYERAEDNGISHFLEHMLYRGAGALGSAYEVNRAFESLGGDLYAATMVDMGVLSCSAPWRSLPQLMPHFAEVALAPKMLDIETEKGIVEEEILEDLDEDGALVDADCLSRQLIYGEHPLGYPITGHIEQVRSFQVPQLRAHHARHYVARNAVLVFSGRVDAASALDWAERCFGAMPSGERLVPHPPKHEQEQPRVRHVRSAGSQTELRVSFRGRPRDAAERAALELGLRVLDDGMSTRVYHRVVDQAGLAYDAGANYDGYEDDGVVDLSASVLHERAVPVCQELLALMRRFADEGPREDELEKAKARSRWDSEALIDAPDALAEHYGAELLLGREATLTQRLAEEDAVRPEQVRAWFAELVQPARLNVVAVGMLPARERAKLDKLVLGFR